jgi:TRAP-type C4-dicarboxylate transport system permease large subunit
VLNFVFVSLGVPQQLAKLVAAMPLPPWGVMLLIIGFYLALGTFMEGFSMVITTLPVVYPVILSLGYDPIWFGVIVTMLVEIALISPPDGTVLYVLQGMRKDSGPITDLFRDAFHVGLHAGAADFDVVSADRIVAAARDAIVLEHDPEKCAAVFGKDHAPPTT